MAMKARDDRDAPAWRWPLVVDMAKKSRHYIAEISPRAKRDDIMIID